MLKRLCVSASLVVAIGCGGSKGTSTAPSGTLSLSGKITDSYTSAPIAAATASIVAGPTAGKLVTTDASGSYSFTELPPSTYTVSVFANSYASQSKNVTLTTSQTLDFALVYQTQPGGAVAFEVTGVGTDDDGKPVANATVDFLFGVSLETFAEASSVTDGSGFYRVSFRAIPSVSASGTTAVADFVKSGYDTDTRRFRPTSLDASQTLNFHTYRSRQITAGESTVVTVAPGDAICDAAIDDGPGTQDYACRIVHVVAPRDAIMTLEALATAGGVPPRFEVRIGAPGTPGYSVRVENPTSIPVTAGTEVPAVVEMLAGSPNSQTFTLKTSMSAR
jgi:hypothetical protein